MSDKPEIGSIAWVDLTVPDAAAVRDFYQAVVGWKVEPVGMGDYQDYLMQLPESGTAVSGVCWARGANEGIPPVWLVYLMVEDLDASIAKVLEMGGKVLAGPRKMGQSRFCVIEDPAGAKSALAQR